MNARVTNNYTKLKPTLFILPCILLVGIVIILFTYNALNTINYVKINTEPFLILNQILGKYRFLQYNITQLGDATITLAFLSIFIIYAPKIWEALIPASLVSLVCANVLKNIFLVPRPAVGLSNTSFIIIGKKAIGLASLPSGHTITIFTTWCVLLFAFMPQKLSNKIIFAILTLCLSLIIASSRVAVGAHYPLDVVIGSILGYLCGLCGIFISKRYNTFSWVSNKKFYPIFIILMVMCGALIIAEIIDKNLIIFYWAFICLIISFYKIIQHYVKK